MKTWPCGHVTSLSYQTYLMCPVCALEQGLFTTMLTQEEEKQKYEIKRNLEEALKDSKTFNRQGCPYCGGI